MGLRINTNIASMAAQRNLGKSTLQQDKAFKRLASGDRITSAGDDAAGLSISENLRAQIRSMSQAHRNANDGISFVQVAEGGLSEISNILVRFRELAIQGASDTIGDRERAFIDEEVQSLKQEVDRIANVTEFNSTKLLSGEEDQLEFQVGIFAAESDRIAFDVQTNDVRTSSLGVDGLSIATTADALDALPSVDEALGRVNAARARLGAMQNKLHSTTNNLAITRENLAAARSRIADTDVAAETSNLVKQNILQSAGVSVLAQANSSPTLALSLL